jgi:hypothetical protein
LGYERPPVTDENVEPRAEDAAEKAELALEDRKVRELKKEDPKSSLLTRVASRMIERYKRLVRVNQSYLLSHKYVSKVFLVPRSAFMSL